MQSIKKFRAELNKNIDKSLWPYTWRLRRLWWKILRLINKEKVMIIFTQTAIHGYFKISEKELDEMAINKVLSDIAKKLKPISTAS